MGVWPLVPFDSSVFHLLLTRDTHSGIHSARTPTVTPVHRFRSNLFIPAAPPVQRSTLLTILLFTVVRFTIAWWIVVAAFFMSMKMSDSLHDAYDILSANA